MSIHEDTSSCGVQKKMEKMSTCCFESTTTKWIDNKHYIKHKQMMGMMETLTLIVLVKYSSFGRRLVYAM